MNFRRFSHADDEKLVQSIRGFPVLFNHERFAEAKNAQLLRDNWKAVAAAVGREEESCKKRWRDIRDHYFKIQRKQLRRGAPITTKWALFEQLSFLNNAKRSRNARPFYDYNIFGLNPENSDTENSIEVYEPQTIFKVEAEDSQGAEDEVQDSEMEAKRTKVDNKRQSPFQVEKIMVPPPPEPYIDFHTPSETSRDYVDDIREKTDQRLVLLEAIASKVDVKQDDVDMFMRSIALTVKKFPPQVRAEAKLKILSVVTQLEFPDS